MDSINNLKGMRTYLIGAMDRVPDGGIVWRKKITPYLEDMNINIINPCNANNVKHVSEGFETRKWIEHYKETGQYDKIKNFKNIRSADLRCVDVSDFVIVHLDIESHLCGSYEELFTANRQKKPVLVWCKQGKRNAPNWLFFSIPHEHIFSSMHDVIDYLKYINTKQNTADLNRWLFFNI
jgi:hypothetical protein